VLHNYSEEEFQNICTSNCTVIEAMEKGELVESVHHHELNGEKIFHESRALPTKNLKGETYQVVYIINDVTEKKKAEEALTKYAVDLERSNKLKELFADIMRHDLFNPLGVIKNVGELLEDNLAGDEAKEELSILYRNVDKIEEMVRSAARFGQLENTKEMEFNAQDLLVTIGHVKEGLKKNLQEKNMKLLFPEGEYIAEVNVFIEDVFSNLISNAIKYSPSGTDVSVAFEDELERWKIKIADRGIGVPDEHRKSIFERFKRVEKGSVKGSGLGLAIVKKVVEIHAGEVWVEDNPDGGSVFVFTVPKERKKDA
jgi:signal transduction histidine kinase